MIARTSRTARHVMLDIATVVAISLAANTTGFARDGSTERAAPKACLSSYTDATATICIATDNFNDGLCQALEHFANRQSVPPDFFARLIWRESLFRPDAVSPKGAEGVAQFMPATAKLRGLTNSFDVLAALDASSAYLAELNGRFGNFGLAAAAYNAGESGLTRFLSNGRLPLETRDYVFAITGAPIETWRDNPPDVAAPPLDGSKSFQAACVTLASTRRMSEPVLARSADWAPWGIQLAAHYNPAVADRLFTSAILRLPSPLNAERALIVRQRGGNFGHRPRYAARIGKQTRAEADQVCGAIRRAGGACTVFKNR